MKLRPFQQRFVREAFKANTDGTPKFDTAVLSFAAWQRKISFSGRSFAC